MKVARYWILLFCFISWSASGLSQDQYRALWVDVFHKGFKTPEEVDTLVAVARSSGYNTLLVQMRKASDAYYNSKIEPKNPAVKADFDPLAYLIQKAHNPERGEQRLEVHAWLVAYRVRIPGDNLWQNPEHPFQKYPSWLSQTSGGAKTIKASGSGFYFFDPGVPQIIDYNLHVVRDIIANYDVDGIHFDYMRYPDSDGSGNQWGFNPVAVERFNNLTGGKGKPKVDDPAFSEFRRRQIYDYVRKIYAHVKAWKPHVKVSLAAITWGDIPGGDYRKTSAYNKVMQDWPQLMNDGFLDVAFPMNYKREDSASQAQHHRNWAQFLGQVALSGGRHGVNGVDGEELNSVEGILAQIRDTAGLPGIAGIATYCYAQPRAGYSKRSVPDEEFFNIIGQKAFRGQAKVPAAGWLTNPREGMIKGIVSENGKPVDGALVIYKGRTTHTDGTGFFAFARVAPGSVSVEARKGERVIGTGSAVVQAGRVVEVPVNK